MNKFRNIFLILIVVVALLTNSTLIKGKENKVSKEQYQYYTFLSPELIAWLESK